MTYKVLVKKSVRFKEFKPCMLRLIKWWLLIARIIEKDMYITSANDGKSHNPLGKHPKDEALDARARHLSYNEVMCVFDKLNEFDIDNEYDFVFEWRQKIYIEIDKFRWYKHVGDIDGYFEKKAIGAELVCHIHCEYDPK